MKGLREKICKREGFTLVEMLIVVAIIAILVMVSIPMVNSSLEKARQATDEANNRSAMLLGSVEYLSNYDDIGFTNTKKSEEYTYYVNSAHQGKLDKPKPDGGTPDGYRPVTPQSKLNSSAGALKVTIYDDGTVSTNWTFSAAH